MTPFRLIQVWCIAAMLLLHACTDPDPIPDPPSTKTDGGTAPDGATAPDGGGGTKDAGATKPEDAGRVVDAGTVQSTTQTVKGQLVASRQGAQVAFFTPGAATVLLKGPTRTFSEASAANPVTHGWWVRVLPAAFSGTLDEQWLTNALEANAAGDDDVLSIAMQYIQGAPASSETVAGQVVQVRGDACYGPSQPDGGRQEGADFNDYLGVTWSYPGVGNDSPEALQVRCLDCSGYVRMVFGFRDSLQRETRFKGQVPLGKGTEPGVLARRAVQIAALDFGVSVTPTTGTTVPDIARLQVGDLVFFDAATDDGADVDHVGIYFGPDNAGHARFISSRKTVDGPTLGDVGGRSILDGTGLYATSFRSARRL